MGKQWKKGAKLATAAAKGKIFTKFAKEITIATKLGGPDPDSNPRLKLAITSARSQSCPKDTIERAIKKGSGENDTTNFEELTYEGYGPHGVGIIVECQTDNRNRTASDMRVQFSKNNGNMGETGSVAWMFERVCLIEGSKENISDMEEEAIEVGANDVEKNEDGSYSFYGAPADLDNIRNTLAQRGWGISVAELSYQPTNITEINDEQRQEVIQLLESLEDNEDSHRVYASIKF